MRTGAEYRGVRARVGLSAAVDRDPNAGQRDDHTYPSVKGRDYHTFSPVNDAELSACEVETLSLATSLLDTSSIERYLDYRRVSMRPRYMRAFGKENGDSVVSRRSPFVLSHR